MPADIVKCYNTLHLGIPPGSLGPYFSTLAKKNGGLLKNTQGYRLEGTTRAAMQLKYGKAASTAHANAALTALAAKLPSVAEKEYFREVLISHDGGAFRAAVVMTWNVAYSHLCDHVLANRSADFHARWTIKMPGMHKNKPLTIANMDDINNLLKESQLLEICRDASIITTNVFNVMDGVLKKRNAYAHPSTAVIDQLQTDAYIADLINNAILKIV